MTKFARPRAVLYETDGSDLERLLDDLEKHWIAFNPENTETYQELAERKQRSKRAVAGLKEQRRLKHEGWDG